MRKISIIIMALCLMMPVAALSVADDEPDTPSLQAPAYQQDEETGPAAPAAEEQPPARLPATESNATAKMVDAVSKQLISLQIDVNQLQQQNEQLRQEIAEIQYALYGLAGIVVLLIVLSLVRRGRKSKLVPVTAAPDLSEKIVNKEDDTRGEYDFMGSSEGIPAKLDLARAYIAMEDFTAARETLTEILAEGSEAYRLEAKNLLNKID